jgi:hypothetical protein
VVLQSQCVLSDPEPASDNGPLEYDLPFFAFAVAHASLSHAQVCKYISQWMIVQAGAGFHASLRPSLLPTFRFFTLFAHNNLPRRCGDRAVIVAGQLL